MGKKKDFLSESETRRGKNASALVKVTGYYFISFQKCKNIL